MKLRTLKFESQTNSRRGSSQGQYSGRIRKTSSPVRPFCDEMRVFAVRIKIAFWGAPLEHSVSPNPVIIPSRWKTLLVWGACVYYIARIWPSRCQEVSTRASRLLRRPYRRLDASRPPANNSFTCSTAARVFSRPSLIRCPPPPSPPPQNFALSQEHLSSSLSRPSITASRSVSESAPCFGIQSN